MKIEDVLNNERVWRITRWQFQRLLIFLPACHGAADRVSLCDDRGMKRIGFLESPSSPRYGIDDRHLSKCLIAFLWRSDPSWRTGGGLRRELVSLSKSLMSSSAQELKCSSGSAREFSDEELQSGLMKLLA